MKMYYIYLILLCSNAIVYPVIEDKYTQQTIEHIDKLMAEMSKRLEVYHCPPMPQITINQSVSSDHSSAHQSAQYQKTNNEVLQFNEQSQKTIQEYISHQMESCKGIMASITNFIGNNKIKCTCAGIAALYSYIGYQIYNRQQILTTASSWNSWRNNCSFEEFMSYPAQNIGDDLIYEIQTRYADPENPTNFIYSLVEFSKKLAYEIKNTEELLTIYTWLERVRCSHLFFVDAATIATAQAKLHKLLFIKHIFATWYASYKIEKN